MLLKKCNHSHCNHAKSASLGENNYRQILKDCGLTITKPRLLILKQIMSETLPLTVEELHKKTGVHNCDMATVYRVLGQLTECNVVNAIHLEKDLVHYEYNNPLHHHHHVICNKCRTVEVIEECFLNDLEEFLSKRGYKNLDHKLQFFGICKKCSAA